MKKLSTLFIVLLFSFSFVYAQSKKTDRQKENLIGQVKSVEEATYKATEKFGEVVPDVKQFTTTSEYNKEGSVKYFEFYDVEDKEKTTRTFKYNDKNLLVEQKEVVDGEVSIGKAIYDTRDRVIETNEYDKKGDLVQKVKNKYDSAGRILRTDIYDSDGSLRESEIFEYDFFLGLGLWKKRVNKKAKSEEHWIYELGSSEENPVRLKRFDGEAEFMDLDLDFGGGAVKMKEIKPKDPKKEVKIISYSYNNNGNVTLEETETTKNKVVSSTVKRTYEYDRYGNKTLEKDSDKYYTTYTYEYDATGNWIKQVETRHSYGSVYHYISERKVKYY